MKKIKSVKSVKSTEGPVRIIWCKIIWKEHESKCVFHNFWRISRYFLMAASQPS